MTRRPITTAELGRRGWRRTDPEPRRSKCSAQYAHVDGWRLQHCGHQTAIHPWILRDPKGRPVLTGAAFEKRRPDYGTCWWNLEQATAYVAGLDSHERWNGPRWFSTPAGRTFLRGSVS